MYLRESLECLKEGKPLLLSGVEQGLALEAMKGNRAASPVDLAYTAKFGIPAVTSVYV